MGYSWKNKATDQAVVLEDRKPSHNAEKSVQQHEGLVNKMFQHTTAFSFYAVFYLGIKTIEI